MEAYRAAYQILKGKVDKYIQCEVLRVCFVANRKDSALFYYQQALDCALADKDSSLIGALYHDLLWFIMKKRLYSGKSICIEGNYDTRGGCC